LAVSLLVLRQFATFACWPDGTLACLGEQLTLRRLTRRQLALQGQEVGKAIGWVLEGSVWLMDHTQGDREIFLDRFAPGAMFGELHAFQNATAATAGFVYVAASAGSIAIVSKEFVWKLIADHPSAAQAMVSSMSGRMGEFFRWRAILALPSAGERVAAVLIALKDKTTGALPLGITQQEIAAYANTTRETVTRVMQRLQSTGSVCRNGATWEIGSDERVMAALADPC